MKFQFRVCPNNADTAWKIRALDNEHVFFEKDSIRDTVDIVYDFDDNIDGDHKICIELSGKLPTDTVIDTDGNIIKDNTIELTNFRIDEFDVDKIIKATAVYNHNFNGTANSINDNFFGIAGCNGTIKFEFQSPVYIWLLEAM